MIPIFFNNIIYANGASQKSKGTDFSRNLFLNHLRESIKQYGKNGYLVQYDFKHYFDSIDSKKVCEMMLEKYKEYCPTKEDYESFSFLLNQIMLEEKGLGLGNQTSQIGAV